MNDKESIVFLTDAWGSKHGGINTFNTDMCINVAGVLPKEKFKIICVVTEGSEKEIKQAEDQNVHLVVLKKTESKKFELNRVDEILKKINLKKEKVAWWVGHDVITGPIAEELNSESSSGKLAIFHHMNYEAYASYKTPNTKEKIQNQKRVLSKADIVFAVGPKLAESAEDKTRKKKNKIVEIVPGFPEIEGLEAPNAFSAITFGRLEPESDKIKQASLAIEAFAHAKSQARDPLGNDATLTLIGLSKENFEEDYNKLRKLSEKSKRNFVINASPYSEDRKEIFDILSSHSVCLMLSRHEGFGLVGWEAIAAEVPLIVSKNSGLYMAVEKKLGGMSGLLKAIEITGSPNKMSHQNDVEAISNAIIEIKEKGKDAKFDPKNLKFFLARFFSWKHAAITFAENCGLETNESLADKIMERWTPEILENSLKQSTNMVDQIVKRRTLFRQIWDKMKHPSDFVKRLILFGGISTKLCEDYAAQQYLQWLTVNSQAKLFVCYETGQALISRASILDEELLETKSGLPKDKTERMKEKERRALNLKVLLQNKMNEKSKGHIMDRVHFIPLRRALTSYTMITDNEVFFTPLLEIRSSETLSFSFDQKPRQFNLDVLNYILYHLKKSEQTFSVSELISDVEAIVSNYRSKL
jgi:glycosyltransferase involved in cell wall biosynthesis